MSSGGRAHPRRCRPLSSTCCWRPRPRLQGRPRLYSLGGRFYPRIPRLYDLHPVGSGWFLQIQIRTLHAAACVYLRPPLHPLAASPRSRLPSTSSTASPHAWAYCSGRCGSKARIRINYCRKASHLGGLASSTRPPEASTAPASSPWPRLPSTASPAFYNPISHEFRRFSTDTGTFAKYRIDFFAVKILLGPPRPSGLGGQPTTSEELRHGLACPLLPRRL